MIYQPVEQDDQDFIDVMTTIYIGSYLRSLLADLIIEAQREV